MLLPFRVLTDLPSSDTTLLAGTAFLVTQRYTSHLYALAPGTAPPVQKSISIKPPGQVHPHNGQILLVTVALALLVFLTVIVVGFWKHGLRFLKIFVPSGIPMYILPLITVMEVFSFFVRPVSHSVRRFANMLAGHITLKVFAGFVTMLAAAGVLGIFGATLPFALTIALTALELLVAVLQAYVFAILTSIYLNDALHPGH